MMDLLPKLAGLRFTGKLATQLSNVQAALLLGLGLQHKTLDQLELELGLPASQMLALFNKAMRRMVAALRAVQEAEEAESLPAAGAAGAASKHLTPLAGGGLAAELDAGAKASLKKLESEQASKQQAWLDEGDGLSEYVVKGTDAEWDAALTPGAIPKHVSVKGTAEPRSGGKSSGKASGKKSKGGGGASGGGKRRRGQDM